MSVYINQNYKTPDILSKLSLVANKSAGFGIAPVGTIFPFYGTVNPNPDSLMFCHGQEYDTEAYPDLYSLLGTDTVPDLREVGLVGSGENAKLEIKTHTNYSVGDFEDDQVAASAFSHTHDISHTHTVPNGMVAYNNAGAGTHLESIAAAMRYAPTNVTTSAILKTTSGDAIIDPDANLGDTTHGKQVAVEWLIVARQASLDEFDFPIDNTLQLTSEWPVKNSVITKAIAGDIAVRDSLEAIQSDSTLQLAGKYAYAADTKYVYHYENDSWVLTDIKFGGAGIFYGTQAEWDALENKKDYEYFARTDDYTIDREDNFGKTYSSNTVRQSGNGWRYNVNMTISNVKPGRYLVVSYCGGTGYFIIGGSATVSSGTIKWAVYDRDTYTGSDNFAASNVSGVCVIVADQPVTITVKSSLYANGSGGTYRWNLIGMGA